MAPGNFDITLLDGHANPKEVVAGAKLAFIALSPRSLESVKAASRSALARGSTWKECKCGGGQWALVVHLAGKEMAKGHAS